MSGHLCSACKNWKNCHNPDWFAMSEIRFCQTQVHWLLMHLSLLENGRWPAESCAELSQPSNRQSSGNGTFTMPIEYAAEISWRVNLCGKDGIITLRVLSAGWDIEELADLMGTSSWKLDKRIKRVVRYCSGWNRRKQPYNGYCKRKEKGKNRQILPS